MPPRKWTDEEKQAARERIRLRKINPTELNAPASTAIAERPDEPEEEDASGEDVLKQLAGLFTAASGQKAGRDKAINEALDVLGKLDPFKYPEIASNDTVMAFVDKIQAQRARSLDVPPGTTIGSGIAAYKKPWTKSDLLKGKDMPVEEARRRGFIEWVMFTPPTKFDVTWQGISIIWPADTEGYFPKSHVDVYQQSRRADRWNERHAAWLFNNPGIPFEPDFQNVNSARLKAMDESNGEYYKPGAGLISLAPSPDLIGGEEPPAEE